MVLNVINFIVERIYQFAYDVFCCFLKKDKIVFLCNFEDDKYLNLGCVDRELQRLGLKSEIIFLYKKDKSISNIISHIYAISKSKIILVDCTHWLISKINISKKTKIIYVGHGGGVYKKMGFKKIGALNRSKDKNIKLYGQYSYIVVTTDKFLREVMDNYKVNEYQLLKYGMPRADLLIRERGDSVAKVKKILIAPSYIENNNGERFFYLNLMSIDRVLRKCNFSPVLSIHPDLRRAINIPDGWIKGNYQSYVSMINMCDVLITDRSSIMFDFCCTRKPIIIIDNNEFVCNQWMSVKDLDGINWCRNYLELEKLLTNDCNLIGSEKLFEQQMDLCGGNSSKLLAKFIKEYTE